MPLISRANPAVLRSRYDRERDLPRLVAVWPADVADSSLPARHRLLGKLRNALRRERQRGLAGHWCYDLSRHAGLLAAYRHEAAALAEMERSARR